MMRYFFQTNTLYNRAGLYIISVSGIHKGMSLH